MRPLQEPAHCWGGGNQIRNEIPPLAIMSAHHDSPWTIHATSPEDTTEERKTREIRSYLGLYNLTTCTKPYHSNSMCITTGWGPVSGRVNSKWNMATIISLADIRIGSKILNGATVAEWCCSCKAFVWHTMTVTASVDLIQFSFQLPVVYYQHSYWYCGINHVDEPCGYSRQAPRRVM